VPEVRESGFYPEALEKGLCYIQTFDLTLADVYIQGVSARMVTAILEHLCGTSVSSTQITKAIVLLNVTLVAWHQRSLRECPDIVLNVSYEKVRQDYRIVMQQFYW
jgi:putative transposase